jgi:MFS family permease
MGFFTSRRFFPLFITQYFGAFNDNTLKGAIIILITYNIAELSGKDSHTLVTLAAAAFILPFFIFSALAGQLADKFDRARIAKIVKIFEIAIMVLASIGFILHNAWFLIVVLFASGVHSAFFGPIKYALLPQHLYPNELLQGNGYIEAGTFLAILLGTITGSVLLQYDLGLYIVSATLLTCAIIGYVSSRFIPKSPGPAPFLSIRYNLVQETVRVIRYSRINTDVFMSIIFISWFWFVAATYVTQIPIFVKNYLHTEASVVTIFLTVFSIGIALGALLCGKLLGRAIKSIYVPAAAFGMSLFMIDLYFCSTSSIYFNLPALLSMQQFLNMPISWRIIIDLLLMAVCAGIYIVPLYTMMQHSSDKNFLARIIAANNIFNALFMVLASFFILGLLAINRTIPEAFLIIAAINVIVALFIRRILNHSLSQNH